MATFAWLIGLMLLGYLLVFALVPPLGRRWLSYWHGQGEAHQFFAYRCQGCFGIVTWRRIRLGGCRCGASRLTTTHLSWGEKALLLYLPWAA